MVGNAMSQNVLEHLIVYLLRSLYPKADTQADATFQNGLTDHRPQPHMQSTLHRFFHSATNGRCQNEGDDHDDHGRADHSHEEGLPLLQCVQATDNVDNENTTGTADLEHGTVVEYTGKRYTGATDGSGGPKCTATPAHTKVSSAATLWCAVDQAVILTSKVPGKQTVPRAELQAMVMFLQCLKDNTADISNIPVLLIPTFVDAPYVVG